MPFSSAFLQYILKPKLRAASPPHFTCPTKSWSSAETANPRLRNLYAGTQSWNLLTGFAFFCSASSPSSLSSVVLRRSRNADSKFPQRLFGRSKLVLGRFVSDEYGSVDSDGEAQSSSNKLVNFTCVCWFKLSILFFSHPVLFFPLFPFSWKECINLFGIKGRVQLRSANFVVERVACEFCCRQIELLKKISEYVRPLYI